MLNRPETKWSLMCALRDDISDLSADNDLNGTVVEDSVTLIEVGSNAPLIVRAQLRRDLKASESTFLCKPAPRQ